MTFNLVRCRNYPLDVRFSNKVLLLPWLGYPGDGVSLLYDDSCRKQWINRGDTIARFYESPDENIKRLWIELTRNLKTGEVRTPVSGLLLQIPDGHLYPYYDDENDQFIDHSHYQVAILLQENDTPSIDARAWFDECLRLRDKVSSCLRTRLIKPPAAEYEIVSVDNLWFLPILESVRDSWENYPRERQALPIIKSTAYFAFGAYLEARGDNWSEDTEKHQDYVWAEEWYVKALSAADSYKDAESALVRIAKKRLAL